MQRHGAACCRSAFAQPCCVMEMVCIRLITCSSVCFHLMDPRCIGSGPQAIATVNASPDACSMDRTSAVPRQSRPAPRSAASFQSSAIWSRLGCRRSIDHLSSAALL
jgi:hypothetical protein